jgi:hypothetical protein
LAKLLFLLSDNELAHNDVKIENIIYNWYTDKVLLIDNGDVRKFGL